MAKEELSKKYDPKEVGKKWYSYWTEKGYFHAEDESDKPPFTIVIPPPNVTGSLHLGHALDNTLQDIIIRHRRMSGFNTLWMPGTDHAGIATQNVVEKILHAEGTDRHEVGREKFIEKVWEYKKKFGGKIVEQLKELGASCDWERERFTLDDGLSKAVRKVFVQLYEEGLIYRSRYMTNWCTRCHTALSDLEVEHQDRNGNFWSIDYPLADGSGLLTIATTRPETLLGDSAVAVNPDDERYKKFIGKMLKLPCTDREIPVIADSYVAMDFGTGALKITPAHDPNDYEIGKRHNLEEITVIGRSGKMENVAEKYIGLSTQECRKRIVKDLEEAGLLRGIEKHQHAVGECYRCKTTVEPTISLQWFVKTKPLAEEAIKAVKNGDTEFVPKSWENTYFEWMNNIRDWCISRQIWWGHRIPAWFCDECGEITVAIDDPTACSKCNSENIRQESDVLDTWFSSGLWPFSTLGWPDDTKALKTFYPTAVLVTGFDIIFFWVARMMMMGLKFRGEVPFKKVYIHALIRDAEGKKMSKSKGNVIDPLELMFDYGGDALRFTVCSMESQGRDARMSEKRIEGNRNFVNKLWNASRFLLMNINEGEEVKTFSELKLDLSDRWIISRLQKTIASTEDALQKFRFNDLATTLYAFTWNEFCDWYIEFQKKRLDSDDRETAISVLVYVLDKILKLLHPVMPFVTEEIYQKLPIHGESIMIEEYPKFDESLVDESAENKMKPVMELLTSLRTLRSELKITPALKLKVFIKVIDEEVVESFNLYLETIKFMANLETVNISTDMKRPPLSATAVIAKAEAFIPLEGVIDIEAEKARIGKEITKTKKELTSFEKKLSNKEFVKNAPKEVLEKNVDISNQLKKQLGKLTDSISWLNSD